MSSASGSPFDTVTFASGFQVLRGFYQFPTTIEDWTQEDVYHNSLLIGEDLVLDAAQEHAKEEGLPPIAVSRAQGKFLNLLVKTAGAKRILEVGTLGG